MPSSYEFTSPVDPNTNVVLSNGWVDATGYGGTNQFGPHPGHDLNKNTPVWNSDAGAPIYSIGDGVVTCSQHFKTWGWVIVIDHSTIAPKRTLWSRYAHVLTQAGKVRVKAGDRVERGQVIAYIGNADGTQADHLHVDLSPTDILKYKPEYYPKTQADVRTYFIDMVKYLLNQEQSEQPEQPPMGLVLKQCKVITSVNLTLREWPDADSAKIGSIPPGSVVTVAPQIKSNEDGYVWTYAWWGSNNGWLATADKTGKPWLEGFQ